MNFQDLTHRDEKSPQRKKSKKHVNMKQVNGEIFLLPDIDDVILITIPISYESRWYRISGPFKMVIKKLEGKIVEVTGTIKNPENYVDTLTVDEILSIMPRLCNLTSSVHTTEATELIASKLLI